MTKKRILLLVGVAAFIYTLPQTTRKLADGCDNLANKFEEMSMHFRLASICVQIVKDHPELHGDPRLVDFLIDDSFFDIKKNYDKD